MVVSRRLPRKSVCTSPTRLKNLSGDTDVDLYVPLKLGFPFDRDHVEIVGMSGLSGN